MSRKNCCTLSDELICKFEKGDSYYEDETQRCDFSWMAEDHHLHRYTYIFLRISINALIHNSPGNQRKEIL